MSKISQSCQKIRGICVCYILEEEYYGAATYYIDGYYDWEQLLLVMLLIHLSQSKFIIALLPKEYMIYMIFDVLRIAKECVRVLS